MLYYSVPVLSGILQNPYYLHYCLLVKSLHLLLSDYLTVQNIHLADVQIHKFYAECETLYGNTCISDGVILNLNLV